MKIVNIRNYGGEERVGQFENIQEPVTTRGGAPAFLVSNYSGLYGVAIGSIYRAELMFVTDSWEYAKKQHEALEVLDHEGR